jgi:hypothetical protein
MTIMEEESNMLETTQIEISQPDLKMLANIKSYRSLNIKQFSPDKNPLEFPSISIQETIELDNLNQEESCYYHLPRGNPSDLFQDVKPVKIIEIDNTSSDSECNGKRKRQSTIRKEKKQSQLNCNSENRVESPIKAALQLDDFRQSLRGSGLSPLRKFSPSKQESPIRASEGKGVTIYLETEANQTPKMPRPIDSNMDILAYTAQRPSILTGRVHVEDEDHCRT